MNRPVAVMICLSAAMLCLAYAYQRSVLPEWWRGHGGGIPYVVFWISFWFMFFPFRRCILPICVFAATFTCVLEFTQLWKPQWLMQFRATRFGAALVGSGFTWNDFPPYFMGGVLGFVILWLAVTLHRGSSTRRKPTDR